MENHPASSVFCYCVCMWRAVILKFYIFVLCFLLLDLSLPPPVILVPSALWGIWLQHNIGIFQQFPRVFFHYFRPIIQLVLYLIACYFVSHILFVSRVTVNTLVFLVFMLGECSSARTYPGFESCTVPFSQSHFIDIPMYNFPSKTGVTSYLYYSDAFRCMACSFPKQFIPKSSTSKVKLIVLLECVHSPGFSLRVDIHTVPGVLLRYHVLFVLFLGFYASLIYLCEYVPIVRFFLEIVFFHIILWYHGYLYHDILCSIHLVFQVKIFYVHVHVYLFNV